MEFLVPEILQLDEATIQSFIDSNDDLKRYEFDLKLINEKRPHILDANTEKLLTEHKTHFQRLLMYMECLAMQI